MQCCHTATITTNDTDTSTTIITITITITTTTTTTTYYYYDYLFQNNPVLRIWFSVVETALPKRRVPEVAGGKPVRQTVSYVTAPVGVSRCKGRPKDKS